MNNTNPLPVVSVRNLNKQFAEGGRDRVVIDRLDHDFVSGEFTVLLGRSGSGKSTLLNLISGIEIPNGGEIVINGKSITAMTDSSARCSVAITSASSSNSST